MAIRSALVQPVAEAPQEPAAAAGGEKEAGHKRGDWGRLLLYAGVGLVPGASPHAE